MEGLVCDACGEGLLIEADVRYVVKIEGYAAYDPMEITRQDLEKDLHGESERLLEELSRTDPEAAQDQVHRAYRFDLCARCWARYVKDPLGVRGEEDANSRTRGENEKGQGD